MIESHRHPFTELYMVHSKTLLTCEMWSLQGFHHVNGWVVPSILKKHSTFDFKGQKIPRDTWRWRHYIHSKWEPLTQQNSSIIISQKSWIVRWLTTCHCYTHVSFHAQWQMLIKGYSSGIISLFQHFGGMCCLHLQGDWISFSWILKWLGEENQLIL
jgi:hypothetical protein